jgi:hypothetical protein
MRSARSIPNSSHSWRCAATQVRAEPPRPPPRQHSGRGTKASSIHLAVAFMSRYRRRRPNSTRRDKAGPFWEGRNLQFSAAFWAKNRRNIAFSGDIPGIPGIRSWPTGAGAHTRFLWANYEALFCPWLHSFRKWGGGQTAGGSWEAHRLRQVVFRRNRRRDKKQTRRDGRGGTAAHNYAADPSIARFASRQRAMIATPEISFGAGARRVASLEPLYTRAQSEGRACFRGARHWVAPGTRTE